MRTFERATPPLRARHAPGIGPGRTCRHPRIRPRSTTRPRRSPRTRRWEVRVRLGTCAFAQYDGASDGSGVGPASLGTAPRRQRVQRSHRGADEMKRMRRAGRMGRTRRCGPGPDGEMSLSRRERWSVGPDRCGDGGGRACAGAHGAPGAVRGGGVSESVAKAPRAGIGRGGKRGISTFLFRCSDAIGAFATDSDNPRRRGPPGGAPRDERRPWRAPPAPRRALRTRTCSSNRHSRGQNAHLDEEGAGHSLADRGAGPAPEHLRRPGEKGSTAERLPRLPAPAPPLQLHGMRVKSRST